MRALCIAWLMLTMVVAPALAQKAVQQARWSDNDLASLLKGKLTELSGCTVATDDGTIFTLARDEQTRKLEWYLLDAARRRVVRHGTCPFQAFQRSTVSPDGRKAVVFTRYPSTLQVLDTSTGQWSTVLESAGRKSLSLPSFAPLVAVDAQHAISVVDETDAEGFITASHVVRIGLTAPFTVEKIVSLAELTQAAQAAIGGASKEWNYQVDAVRFGADREFVFVLRTQKFKTAEAVDYLMHFSPPNTVKLLHKTAGRILPLDYRASRVLFRTTENGQASTWLMDGGKAIRAHSQGALAGSLHGDTIVLSVVQGKKLQVLVGPAGGVKPVLSLTTLHALAATRGGAGLILMNDKQLAVYSIK